MLSLTSENRKFLLNKRIQRMELNMLLFAVLSETSGLIISEDTIVDYEIINVSVGKKKER